MPMNDAKTQSELTEHCIVLMNGTKLVCYPKFEPADRKTTTEYVDLESHFYDNAFLFFHNAHRILSDSRMFLAPVPVQSGMAYSGTSGFCNPTLGVYVEWWLNCMIDMTKDNNGNPALTCRIAGSPLSGSNRCTCVYPNGERQSITHHPFRDVWSSFTRINNRYTKAKAMYEAYTLDEVVELLLAGGVSREAELETRLDIAEGNAKAMKGTISRLQSAHERLLKQYEELVMLHFRKDLDELRVEYRAKKDKAEQEIAKLKIAKSEYKLQLSQGAITNVEYQRAITPLTRRKKEIEHELRLFEIDKTRALVSTGHITLSKINEYIDPREGD